MFESGAEPGEPGEPKPAELAPKRPILIEYMLGEESKTPSTAANSAKMAAFETQISLGQLFQARFSI